MSKSTALLPAVQSDSADADAWGLHPTITDEDMEAEREYWASEQRRYAVDPTEADLAWWFEQTRDDEGQEPDDAYYDDWCAESLAQDRIDAGCLL